jgi:hypothetical protein
VVFPFTGAFFVLCEMTMSTSSSSSSSSGGLPEATLAIMNWLNDLLHLPVLEDLAWYVYWFVSVLFAPLLALPGLLGMAAHDLYSGAFLPEHEEAKGRAVLITGCDTGFGHDLALELYAKGWKVYAGCLR